MRLHLRLSVFVKGREKEVGGETGALEREEGRGVHSQFLKAICRQCHSFCGLESKKECGFPSQE